MTGDVAMQRRGWRSASIALLLGALGGCALVERGGDDLTTAGHRISNSAAWVQGKMAPAPPVVAGQSAGYAAQTATTPASPPPVTTEP